MASPAMRLADGRSLPQPPPLPAKSASSCLRQLPAQVGNQADDPHGIRVGRVLVGRAAGIGRVNQPTGLAPVAKLHAQAGGHIEQRSPACPRRVQPPGQRQRLFNLSIPLLHLPLLEGDPGRQQMAFGRFRQVVGIVGRGALRLMQRAPATWRAAVST